MACRKAVCIGINAYPDEESRLLGCVNDADAWAGLLGARGFDTSVLVESQATRANIVAAIRLAVASLRGPGDVCAVFYSGHGTWMPDLNGDEPDGKDEALCPVDMGNDGANLILDDEITVLFSARPRGARIFFVTDCCNSGTVFRFMRSPAASPRRVRYIPPTRFLKSPDLVRAVERLGPTGPRRSNAAQPGVVHLSGCRDVEYSIDSVFDGKSGGVLTHFATRAFDAIAHDASYAEWYKTIRSFLPSADFPQTPLLNATKAERALPLFA